MKTITHYNQIIKEAGKGEIPSMYNARIVSNLYKLCPDQKLKIDAMERRCRMQRMFGEAVVYDIKKLPRVIMNFKNGVMLKAFVIRDVNGCPDKTGCVIEDVFVGVQKFSILNDSVTTNNKKTLNSSKEGLNDQT